MPDSAPLKISSKKKTFCKDTAQPRRFRPLTNSALHSNLSAARFWPGWRVMKKRAFWPKILLWTNKRAKSPIRAIRRLILPALSEKLWTDRQKSIPLPSEWTLWILKKKQKKSASSSISKELKKKNYPSGKRERKILRLLLKIWSKKAAGRKSQPMR